MHQPVEKAPVLGMGEIEKVFDVVGHAGSLRRSPSRATAKPAPERPGTRACLERSSRHFGAVE